VKDSGEEREKMKELRGGEREFIGEKEHETKYIKDYLLILLMKLE
jgi:hypothetical protein